MVRELKKPSQGLKGLEELEELDQKEVEEIERQRQNDFGTELDAGFFFSVVFDTYEERQKWLSDHGIKLEEDFFVKARDFNV
jgi:hypothetical protein